MVRGVYWNIKFVSLPWWCIFSCCFSHVLTWVDPLTSTANYVLLLGVGWASVNATRNQKHQFLGSRAKKNRQNEKPYSEHCYHCRVQAQTWLALPVTLCNTALESVSWCVVRYGWRPQQAGLNGDLWQGSNQGNLLSHPSHAEFYCSVVKVI